MSGKHTVFAKREIMKFYKPCCFHPNVIKNINQESAFLCILPYVGLAFIITISHVFLNIWSGVDEHERVKSGILLLVKEKWIKKIQSW